MSSRAPWAADRRLMKAEGETRDRKEPGSHPGGGCSSVTDPQCAARDRGPSTWIPAASRISPKVTATLARRISTLHQRRENAASITRSMLGGAASRVIRRGHGTGAQPVRPSSSLLLAPTTLPPDGKGATSVAWRSASHPSGGQSCSRSRKATRGRPKEKALRLKGGGQATPSGATPRPKGVS